MGRCSHTNDDNRRRDNDNNYNNYNYDNNNYDDNCRRRPNTADGNSGSCIWQF
ncbi:MAG: hypothetical protein ACKOJG_10435 [Actinomycetota bacterium]